LVITHAPPSTGECETNRMEAKLTDEAVQFSPSPHIAALVHVFYVPALETICILLNTMSGAEPIAILGAISSVITVVETFKEIFEAARNAKGLHESFGKISDNVAIILSTLHQARLVQEQAVKAHQGSNDVTQRLVIEEESRAVGPVMNLCKTNAEILSVIFASIHPKNDTSRIRRYKNAIGISMPSRKRKVQSLLRETMEGLQLLHTYHSFNTMTTMGQLHVASEKLPAERSSSKDVTNRLSPSRQPRAKADDASLVMLRERKGDSKTTKSPSEHMATVNRDPQNVWMNASSTKVMNQIASQTVHGSQNFTL
jgi:hypothetical protein